MRTARSVIGTTDVHKDAGRPGGRDRRPVVQWVTGRGRHLATWVNGRQVTDWVDDPPEDDCPRRGLRTEPGTIQLQVHDRQTDVEFRSITFVDPGTRP